MTFKEGDVLIAHVLFEDGKGSKKRPVIVLKHIPEKDRYVICECSSDKETYSAGHGLYLIKEGTEVFNMMGIDCDTHILRSVKAIYGKNVIHKIGEYSDIENLKKRLK